MWWDIVKDWKTMGWPRDLSDDEARKWYYIRLYHELHGNKEAEKCLINNYGEKIRPLIEEYREHETKLSAERKKKKAEEERKKKGKKRHGTVIEGGAKDSPYRRRV